MSKVLIAFMAIILLISFPAYSQNTMTFNFQGRLNDSSGNPVPDGSYQMMFFIYADSTGGTPLWTESHPAVQVGNGVFNIELGSSAPCSLSLAARPNIFLSTQIGSLPPLSHRLKITTTPVSGVSRRIVGDLQTSPGSMIITNPEDAQASISLNTGSETMGIVIEERPTDPINGRRFHAGLESGEVTLGLEGPDGQQMISGSAKPGSLGSISWRMFNPQPEPPARDNPVIEMSTGVSGEGSIVMFNPQPEPPGPDPSKLFEMSTGIGSEASWVMFNPQPEPPAGDPSKLIEISNGVGGEAGIYMFNPQPEPPATDPFFGLTARANGPNLAMFAPQIGGTALVNNHPQLRMHCDSTSTDLFVQRARTSFGGPSESTGVFIHADSNTAELRVFQGNNPQVKITSAAAGATMSFIDDGSEYMGVEPSPWHSGGQISMKGTGGLQTMILGSDGSIGMLDDGSEYMGIEPSPWHSGGDLTMSNAAGGITLLLASNGMVSIGTGNHTNILTIQQNSATDPIADAWTTYSSRRWKTNIQPLQGSLAEVMKLQGVSFDWRENNKHDIGLIAEEVGKVVPEVVAYEENGVDAKSVDYARLTALLIEAVKEQQKTIEQLKSDVQELKNKGASQ